MCSILMEGYVATKLKSDPWNRKDITMEKWSNTSCSCDALMNWIFFLKDHLCLVQSEGTEPDGFHEQNLTLSMSAVTGILLHFFPLMNGVLNYNMIYSYRLIFYLRFNSWISVTLTYWHVVSNLNLFANRKRVINWFDIETRKVLLSL